MDFINPYSRDVFIEFLQNKFLPEDYTDNQEELSIPFKSTLINKVTSLGEVPSLKLKVFEVCHGSEHDPRVTLSREAFRIMALYRSDKSIVVFHSKTSDNYRLSLITMELSIKGKKVQKEYSNPRRYSFYLGPDAKTHTPKEYLIKKGRVTDYNNLQDRFSVEVVNKDFYNGIAMLFTKLAGGKRSIGRKTIDVGRGLLDLPGTTDDTLDKEFTVRLIGRLVFCWFLKKKVSKKGVPLISEDILSSGAVNNNNNYYHNILEPLYFQILNKPAKKRDKIYHNNIWNMVPFLNGGLFTPNDNDFYELDKNGVSKYIKTLTIPNEWLKELLELFETYNFTIDEDTSIDIELSIDPEMLGRIFENLLAEIVPETGKVARKSTGSYYTPRTIVNYMVDQSIKEYLITKTKVNEIIIDSLLSYEDDDVTLSTGQKEDIINALDEIKIIDPACGSGAFPMGILNKMLLVLNKIDPESKEWFSRKLRIIDNELIRKELEKKYKDENWDYIHKLGIIQTSIYGVDIQPIAVEISKLRFFLSLIIDERVRDDLVNRGIKTLPNLEFKFVCANSLIPLEESTAQQDLFDNTDLINETKLLRDKYFNTNNVEEKLNIENKYDNILNENQLCFDSHTKRRKQLLTYHPFKVDNVSSFFDSKFMFGIEKYDIVIANPPYFTEKDNHKAFDLVKASEIGRVFYEGRMDYFYFFIENTLKSLVKNKGIFTYITTNYWATSSGAKKLRKCLKESSYIKKIVNFNEIKLFETAQGQHNLIIIATPYNNSRNISDIMIFNCSRNDIIKSELLISKLMNPENQTDVIFYKTDKLFDANNNLVAMQTSHEAMKIRKKMEVNAGFMKDEDIGNGIDILQETITDKHVEKDKSLKIGSGVYVLTEEEMDSMGMSKKEKYYVKPFYESNNTLKYFASDKISRYLIYANKEVVKSIDELSKIKTHLDKYKSIMTSANKPYGLNRPRDEFYFKGEKLLVFRMTESPCFSYVSKDSYVSRTFMVIKPKEKRWNILYLCALLNSKIAYYWFYNFGKRKGSMLQIDKEPLCRFPVKTEKEMEKNIVGIMEGMSLYYKEMKHDRGKINIDDYKNSIDKMIYKIYGLSPAEIKVVESIRKK